MSILCLTISQSHEVMKGLTGRPGDRYHMADDISTSSSRSIIRLQSTCSLDTVPPAIKMPRTPIKATVKVESQPYPSSSPTSKTSNSKDDGSAKKVKADRTGEKASAWTAEEQKQLLHFALNRNGRGWEEAVPGKTGNQAGTLWR